MCHRSEHVSVGARTDPLPLAEVILLNVALKIKEYNSILYYYSFTQINTFVLKVQLSLLTKCRYTQSNRTGPLCVASTQMEVKRHHRPDLTSPSRDTRLPTRVTGMGKAEVSRPASRLTCQLPVA